MEEFLMGSFQNKNQGMQQAENLATTLKFLAIGQLPIEILKVNWQKT